MQKDKENGVLKPADDLCEEHIKAYHSDCCNARKLNKRFFQCSCDIGIHPSGAFCCSHLISLKGTETDFLCAYLCFHLVWEAGRTLTISSNFIPASSDLAQLRLILKSMVSLKH